MSQKIYLLDTNIISEPTKVSPDQNLIQKLADNLDYSCICSIIWAEVLSGVKLLPEGKRKTGLFDYFVNNVQKFYDILPFDTSCASIYSDLIQRLKEKGKASYLSPFDIMIAATAIANNLILVTKNVSNFGPIKEISNLMIENWCE